MNRLLYLLAGFLIAAVIAATFFERINLKRMKINATDGPAVLILLAVLLAGVMFLVLSPWGRRLNAWFDKKTKDHDDEVRRKARTEGKVRTPPLGPLP